MEINFSELKKAVSLSEKISGKHMTLPVLSCFLFVVKKNNTIIKATNLDLGIEVTVPVRSDSETVFAVPASILSSFLSQVVEYDGTVKIESISNNIQITTKNSKGVIKTVPHEDFPNIPNLDGDQKTSIPPDLLVKGLKSVWYSASVSSIKPELSSVYLYTNGDKLVFVSTDSFRLAEKKVQLPGNLKINDILLPLKNVADVVRTLEAIGENITITVGKNLISFEVDGKLRLVSRIIDGVFPDYKQIIPKTYIAEAVVLKHDFFNALKVSNIFSDKFNQVHFSIDPKTKVFEIETRNNDIGENKTTVDAKIDGEKMEINFNYKYIIDCFQSIDSDSVSLQLGGPNRPMVIKPVSGDQSFLYLAMPMNR